MSNGPGLPGPDHLRHLLRAVVWQPVLVGGGVALAFAYDGFRTGTEQTLAAAAVALGCSFVLDDPAWVTLATSPAPLWWRRAVRLALVLPMAGALWLAATQVAGVSPPTGAPGVLEAGGLTGVALAAAAVAARLSGHGLGGAAAGPVLLVLLACSLVLPRRWAVYPVVAHQGRWVLLLAGALATLMFASRDPAARGGRPKHVLERPRGVSTGPPRRRSAAR